MLAGLRTPLGGDGVTFAAVLGCVAVALGACGNSRTAVPSSVAPVSPSSFRTLTYSAQGIAVSVPRNWSVIPGRGPLISTLTSGAAVMALWRFPRSARPPAGRRTLQRVKRELVNEARGRDPGLRLVGASLLAVAGAPAIELDAFERVGGQPRRVRSTHVFEPHAEVVLDEYAPPGLFQSVDEAVFVPVERSLSPLRAGS